MMEINKTSLGRENSTQRTHAAVVAGSTAVGGILLGTSKATIEAQDVPPDIKQNYINDLCYPLGVGFTLYLCWAISHFRKILKNNFQSSK